MGRVFVSAKTYVKDYGWHKAKEMLNKARGCRTIKVSGYFFLYDDLERLVKSYELVQGYGGLRLATNFRWSEKFKALKHDSQSQLDNALKDVESCL